jgi:hypothetical protein
VTRGPRPGLGLPASVAALAAALLLLVSPLGSGAYWTATTSPSSAAVGAAQWCMPPAAAASNAQYVKLSTLTSTASGKVAILPVGNTAAWGGGTGTRTIKVTLFSCQDAAATTPPATLADSLRVTSWAVASTSAQRGWLNSTQAVAPGARLDPTSALGTTILGYAQKPAATTTLGDNVIGRYSWGVASGRTAAAPAANPTVTCPILSLVLPCSLAITNGAADDTFAQAFDTNPWDGVASVNYTLTTFATQSSALVTGWSGNLDLNGCLLMTVLGCTPTAIVPAMTVPTGTTDAQLSTANGNALQWLVLQWTGSTTPTDDIYAQVTLS